MLVAANVWFPGDTSGPAFVTLPAPSAVYIHRGAP